MFAFGRKLFLNFEVKKKKFQTMLISNKAE